MLRTILRVITGLALVLGVAGTAGAVLYKWTDAQGRVVYSDQPPPPNVKSAQLQAAPPPANPNAARELAEKEAADRKRGADEVAARAAADKAHSAQAALAQDCAMAKGNLQQLADLATPVTRYGADGQREVMSDAARTQERTRLTAWMRDNHCPG